MIAGGLKFLLALKHAEWLKKPVMKMPVHRERSERIQFKELSKGIEKRKFKKLNPPRRRMSRR